MQVLLLADTRPIAPVVLVATHHLVGLAALEICSTGRGIGRGRGQSAQAWQLPSECIVVCGWFLLVVAAHLRNVAVAYFQFLWQAEVLVRLADRIECHFVAARLRRT